MLLRSLWCLFPFLFLWFVVTGCEDDAMGIGKGILPESDDYVLFADSDLRVVASTVEGNPVRVNPLKPSNVYASAPSYYYHAFGSHYDDTFGEVTAGLGMSFLMERVGKNFGTGATVDSLVLFLKYQVKKGENSHPVAFDIYELNTLISDSIPYLSDFSLEGMYQENPIHSGFFEPSVTDSFASIRITDAALIEKLISLDSTDMVTDSTFWTHFQGFYLKPSYRVGDGQIYYLSMFISEMDLFYHNNTSDSLFFRFLGYPYASVSSIGRDYTGTIAGAAIDSPDYGDFSFIAASAGPVAPVRFPGSDMEAWFDEITGQGAKGVALNKAELDIFPADGQDVTLLPRSLALQIQSEDGEYELIEYLSGGLYSAVRGCYTFDITVLLQNHLKMYYAGELTFPRLVLVAGQNPYTPYQVVIDNRKTKIRTVYSQSQ